MLPIHRLNAACARRAMSTGFKEVGVLKGTPGMLAHRLPLTKIVATIGPASGHQPVMGNIVNAGMRLMRLNFSHAVS